MPESKSPKLLREAAYKAPRPVILWIAAIAGIVAALAAVHARDNTAQETPLRASFDACVKASNGVTFALNECIGTEHAYQDKRLNIAYQQLRKSLPRASRMALRDEERVWIVQRDKTCAADGSGGTASLLDANQCQLYETAARAAVLEARTAR